MIDHKAMLHLLIADGAAEHRLEDPLHQHIYRAGVLVRFLLILEHYKINFGNAELEALREIRNAVVHNGGDLSLNRYTGSLELVQKYYSDLVDGNVPSMHHEPLCPFFSLHGSIVRFDVHGISEHCRQVFMKNISL